MEGGIGRGRRGEVDYREIIERWGEERWKVEVRKVRGGEVEGERIG